MSPKSKGKSKSKSKSPAAAAGEFVREEIRHIREGKHGARSTEQAIAIGLSKARRAGVRLKAPESGPAKKQAERDLRFAREGRAPDPKRSRAALKRLKRASKTVASHAALSRHGREVARRKKR